MQAAEHGARGDGAAAFDSTPERGILVQRQMRAAGIAGGVRRARPRAHAQATS